MDPQTPEEYFADDAVGRETYERVHAAVTSAHPDVVVRVSKSQVAFRRRTGFAYLWVPGRYLRRPAAPVVLTIALHHRVSSPRIKEVVHPGPWMHHLEIQGADDIDEEVLGWLRQAADEAAPPG